MNVKGGRQVQQANQLDFIGDCYTSHRVSCAFRNPVSALNAVRCRNAESEPDSGFTDKAALNAVRCSPVG